MIQIEYKKSKMKPKVCLYLFLMFALGIYGCAPAGSTTAPTGVKPLAPSPTLIPPTSTSTFTPIESSTATPPATLESREAEETIRTLLQDSVDCESPCFWGITPGQTTLSEAISIFTHLGLQVKSTTYQGKDFYGIEHDFDNGLSISVILTIQSEIVENLRLKILPEKSSAGIPRKWSAYSPETLINRYGTPSKVDFFLDKGPNLTFAMDIYFDSVDLIVQYGITNIIPYQNSPQVCPLTAQFDSVRVWMGKDPYAPPFELVPLEKATSMTMEEFSKLMTGDPEKACFIVDGEAFP